jgi:hypothetical protein
VRRPLVERHLSSLELALELGFRSLAFRAITCGA